MMKSNSLTNRILALALTLVMVLGMLPSDYATAEEALLSAVITFDDTAKRTSVSTEQQVWQENGITVTNNKASSTTNVNENAYNPVRCYKGSEVILAYPGMEQIAVETYATRYATALVNSLASVTGATATADGTTVTIALDAPVDSLSFALTGQVRMNSITVYYSAAEKDGDGTTTEPETPVEPEEEVTGGSTLTIIQANELGIEQGAGNSTTEKYYVTGVVESIKNSTWGNLYIADADGNKLFIWGTYDEANNRYDVMDPKPIPGDTITVYGVIGTKDGTEARMENAVVTAYTAGTTESNDPADGSTLTITQAVELGKSKASNVYTSGSYYVTGVVTEVKNTTYGNMYIADESGNTLLLYGTYDSTGTIRYDAMATKPVVGDQITVYGQIGNYNGAAQIKKASVKEHVPAVCKIGDTAYLTLADAVSAAKDGDTITLLGNASGAGVVINKDITIDFGGYTYTLTSGVGSTGTPTNGLQILSGNDVTLKNGTLTVAEANKNDFYILIQNYADSLTIVDMTLDGTNLDKYSATDGDSYTLSNNSGNVTVNGNTNIIANNEGDLAYAFDVCKYGSYAVPTVTVNTTGKITGNVQVSEGLEENLTITGGTYTTDVSAYVPIGYKQENGAVVEDSVIDTEAELRHYIALGGEVTLGDNITLTGPITIDKDVTLNLNGYKLTLPDHDNYGIVVKDSLTINGNGYVQVNGNYGIGLSTSCTGGLTVNGGVFTGAGNCDYMIGAYNGKVTINGGEFTTPYCVVNSFDGYNATVEINGGKLSADYPVLGTNVTVSDAATLDIDEFLCVIGNDYYHTLASAVAGAEDGDTITLLTDGTGAGAVVNKDITIDFAGHTYTLTEGVGSSGTPTNGLQLLSGSDVTLKNGTLEVAEANKGDFYILVQNYADSLTVTDMVLDGTNLDKYSSTDGDSYTLSNNSGNVTVNGKTDIIANDEGDKAYAFDVCKFSTYAAPSVNVATTGTVTGNIEVSEGLEENLSISSGTYTMDVSEYVVDTHAAVPDGDVYIIRLKQTGFGFEKGNEISVDYSEDLTFTNLASGGEVNANVNYTLVEGKEIATLNSGVLTITGDGVIVVRADKAGNDTYAPVSATYTLTVNKGTGSITTESDNVELTFGVQSYKMPVTTVGDGVVSYAISETDVAVSIEQDGTLKFDPKVPAVGTFTVTITMADGDNYNGTTASYTVELNYAEISEDAWSLVCAEAAENGWYKHTVTIQPGKTYKIAEQTEDGKIGVWYDAIIVKDGIHNKTVYLKDGSGNISAPIQIKDLKIDTKDPEVSISNELPVFETIWNKLFFVSKDDVTLHVTYKDIAETETSGIASVEISLDGEKYTALSGIDTKSGTFDINLPVANDSEGTQYVVLVKVTDVAGNSFEAKVNPDKDGITTIVVDKDGPEIEADVKGAVENSNVYFTNGKDFTIEYTVTDENLAVYDAKNPIALNLKTNNTVENAISIELTDENGTEFQTVFTPDTEEDGQFTITANVTDTAGNVAEEVVRTYVIDKEAPTISLNHGIADQDLHDGIYYTATESYALEIVINEGLFEIYQNHGIEPKVTVNGEEVKSLTWSADGKANLPLSSNGVYKITVSYDNLVHDAVTESIEICVDHEVPVITLTPDIELVKNDVYYTSKENYGLKISLDEDLYDHYLDSEFKPVVTVNGEETKLDWSKPEAVLTLAENGVYEVVVSYENHLHKAETKTITICVDHEIPVITLTPDIELVKDDVYYTSEENYGLKISLNDDLYDHYLDSEFKPVVTVNGEEYKLDWSKPEAVLPLDANGVYEVVVSYENHLHKAETKTITICVDHEIPVITLTPDIELVKNDVYYTSKENYGLKISLNEDLYEHYLSCGFKPVVTVNGEEYKLDWSKPEAVLTLADNGVYEVVVSYENHLHKAETKTITICVDHEVPVIELLHGIEDPDLLVDGIYYTDNDAYALQITLDEDLYDHYLSCEIAPVVTVNGVETELTWTKSGKDPAVLQATLPLTVDGEYKIVVNYANYLHTAEEKTITIYRDTMDPEVSITYRDADGKDIQPYAENLVHESVFNQAVTAVITVKDVKFDQNSVELTVTPANEVAAVGAYAASWTEVSKDVWECVLVLNVAADYDIAFACQDYANNSASAAADLAVDIEELPDNFQFGYSQSLRDVVMNELTFGFWNGQVTVTVDIVDDISGVETVSASYDVATDAYAEGNAAGTYDNLKVVKSETIANGYRVTFLIPEDALTKENQVNGNLTVVATDYAGNKNTATDGLRLIVDDVEPERNVTITDPVNQTETVKYYDGNIVVGINIFEANYRYYNDAQITVTKDGVAYGLAGHTTGWYKGVANATNTLTLNEDGDYQVTVTYTDGSNNPMLTWTSGNLTLDTVAPVITVSNIEQNSANKDEVYGFTITVTDINLDVQTVKPVLTAVVQGENGLYSTEQIDLGTAQVSADGTTVTYTVENLDQDALYTLTCSAEDMSNNASAQIVLEDGEAYETVNFSINRNGSTFGFGTDYMTDLVNQYYVYSVYEDLVIVEVNVDPIENYTVTVNGTELVEGTDYTTEQSSNDGEWSKRTYVINKDLFADEGEYNVIVSSVDKAETTAYSDIKDLGIAFVVDQTAPVLTISGLQTGGRYQTEEQTVTLIPTDEGGRLNSLKVVVTDSDGEPLTNESGEDISVRFDFSGEELLDYLSENGDMVTFTIPSGLEHQVQIVCNDCAVNAEGLTNAYDETFERVTVSQNALIIFYANKPAFYGTLAGVALLIVLIIVLLKRKKKDDKK